ncbi:hypothetical protein BDF22DRAFT_672965 [Syncephalis plumigaleata]|nr:hypothetical protein BDF22DRAFT_672965 [Syncephalis plumigaleata]
MDATRTINSVEGTSELATPENESGLPLHDVDEGSPEEEEEEATLWVEYLPLSTLSDNHVTIDSSSQVWHQLLNKLRKWCENTMRGYQKRSHHDQLVSKETYLAEYARVKARHAHYWIEHWPEKTDPGKFVFEDIAIATWLLCLWEEEYRLGKGKRRPTFIDLGCGNGLLTHLLTMEGSTGMGIDLADRGVWKMYGERTQLATYALQPNHLRFNVDESEHSTDTEACPWTSIGKIDWIIGNHADELVPWIPIIAARSGYTPKFAIIPCCFYTLDGRRNLPKLPGQSRYVSYQRYLENIITTCGYEIEQDQLRIPSTKNIAYVGRQRTFDEQGWTDIRIIHESICINWHECILDKDKATTIEANIHQLACQGDTFKVRMTDRVKNEIRREKKRARLQDKMTDSV